MVSGVDKEELLYLEINFLKLIDFRLMVDPKTFESYYNHLVETSERKAVLRNCSCLDPSHSFKIIKNYEQGAVSNVADKQAKPAKNIIQFDDEESIRRIDNREKRNTTHRNNSAIQSTSSTEVPHSRDNSFTSSNKKLERELRITSFQFTEDGLASSNSVSINKPSELVEKSSSEIF